MTATIWSKFFWSDWANDEALKLCSFAAQGLWMRMLCIAAGASPIGYVSVNNNALDEAGIARLTGADASEVANLLTELERNGVFSRDRHNRIYSRRMVRDAKKRALAQKNGKLGGNPSLGNNIGNSPPDNLQDKPKVKTQEPRASIQEDKPIAQQTPKPREPMLFDKLCAAAGLDNQRLPHQGLAKIAPIIDLIDKGYSLEADILPAIRDAAAARVSFNHWSYFVPMVVERTAKRNAIPVKPPVVAEDWPGRLVVWRRDGTWGAWGPKPGERGCRVPPELLDETERVAA